MKRFKTIFALLFCTLVLFSSSSFSIGLHYCQGELKAVAWLDKADGCDHQKLPPCHRKMMENCCDDEVVVHQGDSFEAVTSTWNVADIVPITFTIQSNHLISLLIPEVDVLKPHYLNYDTPLRSHDLTIAHQVFLI